MTLTTIIILTKDSEAIPYRNLRGLCADMGWKENTLYRKQFPIEKDGYKITKQKIR